MRLVLVVSECPQAPRPGESGELAAAAPVLPALSTVLGKGVRAPAALPWQTRLLRAASLPGSATSSLARIAAHGTPAAQADPLWFAQPVHLQIVTDHLRLPSSGLLRLDDDESAALCADFAAVFGRDGFALHPGRGGGLLLSGLRAAAAGIEPSRLTGERVASGAMGADPAVRRLTSEIELWLHEHAVNRVRARRGKAPVSSLWIWDADVGADADADADAAARDGAISLREMHALHGTDPFLQGLAASVGRSLKPPPSAWSAFTTARSAPALVQLSARAEQGNENPLRAIEENWLQPVLRDVRRGRVRSLQLLMLDERFELTPAREWFGWRRRRPWWDNLLR
jgi:hypothetical protein